MHKGINKLTILLVATSLIACSTPDSRHLNIPTRIIREPAPLVMVDSEAVSKNFKLIYGNDKALETAFRQYAKTGKAPGIKTDGFERFAYSSLQQPIINCMPFQETVITLEPGEKFTSITSGDPQNLSYMVAVSGGSGGAETQQVLVKPGLAKMSTNLVIATDKRIYNILVVVGASRHGITRNAAFWYPEEMLSAVNDKISKQNDVDLNAEKMPQLDLARTNFNYRISGDKPSWVPIRVFDDGRRTWIQFPVGVDNKTLPTLLIQSDSGQDMKYNQSYYSPYMVVDGIWGEAKLIAGVGRKQVEVDITNKNYKE